MVVTLKHFNKNSPLFRKGSTMCLQEKGFMEIHCTYDDEK